MLKKTLIFSNLIAAGLLLLSYASPSVDPNNTWIFAIVGLGYPIWLILNFCFIVFWLFSDLKICLISLISILLGYGYIERLFALNTAEKSMGKDRHSVVSYNISNAIHAYDANVAKRKARREGMREFLSRFDDEDILCVQEVGDYGSEVLKSALTYKYIHQKSRGAIIMSKHPIIKKGEIDFGTITNSCLWADIAIGFDTVRVYSFHLQSNSITVDADKVLDNPDINDDDTWKGVRGILRKYVKNHLTRNNQAKTITSHVLESPYKVILCGDLNDTPITHTYSVISNGLIDNFIKAGYGLGTTFNGRIPLLRIDYIFTSPEIPIYNFNIIKENWSDHYAVASIFSLK